VNERTESRLASWGANRVVLALSLARLADGMGNSLLIVVLPLYVASLPSRWSLPVSVLVGILISVVGLINALVQPVSGAWIDRYGHRKASILVGLGVMIVGTLLLTEVESFTALVLLRIGQGFGFALTLPASLAILKSATARASRGGSMGVFTTFRMIGFSIGPLVGGYLQSRYGFGAAFLAAAAAMALGMLAVALWVHEPEEGPAADARFQLFDRSWLEPGMLLLGLATFVMAFDISMLAALENTFNRRLDQTAFGFGVAFSALTLTRVVFQAPLGRLSDFAGRRPLVSAGLLALAPTTIALGYVTTTFQLTGVRMVQGIATAALAAPAFALAADLATPGKEARQMSLLTMGFALGLSIGPLVAGLLAVVSFTLPFWIGGALAVAVAWIVWRRVPESVRRGGPAEPRETVEAIEPD
jgi:MFS family permease